MASKLFKEAPARQTLEELHVAISLKAEELEEKRIQAAEVAHEHKEPHVTYAKIHVGPVLIDPRDKSESFLVSYSDEDLDAPKHLHLV